MDFLDSYKRIQRNYAYDERGGAGYFRLPAFVDSKLVSHGFSARIGGVSEGCFASLNLSFTRKEDSRENVMENYRRFANGADIEWECMVMDTFEHGATVRPVTIKDAGAGYINPPLPPCDGLITDDPSIALVTGHADCLPLFFLDPVNRAIGLAHAGYQGTLKKIAMNVILMMQEKYKSEPGKMLCGIGPYICGDCYEVDNELKERFENDFPGIPFFTDGEPGKSHIDLGMITVSQYIDCGIRPENINVMGICTYEDKDRLYSYRRDKGQTGGMAAYIKLGINRQQGGVV